MEDTGQKPREKRLRDMTEAEIASLTADEYKRMFDKDRLFTVRDAIEWLSRQNPDAGLMYFEENSNAWCDMSENMFRTAAEEKKRELELQRKWHGDDAKAEEETKEVFRYVRDDDICIMF